MAPLTASSGPRTRPPAETGGWDASGPGGRSPHRRLLRVSRSRWTRWGLPALAVLCVLAAVAALEFPRLSDLWAQHEQQQLAQQLDDPAIGGVSGSGAALGRIVIPAISLEMVVVQGTDASALAKGPGHYPDTPMPCTVGDVAIAGHRTTFLHPFYHLNDLKPGDLIELSTRSASCTYTVTQAPFAVSPSDTSVIDDTPGQFTLTLTTCNPIGSSAQRLIVKATMVPGSLGPARIPG